MTLVKNDAANCEELPPFGRGDRVSGGVGNESFSERTDSQSLPTSIRARPRWEWHRERLSRHIVKNPVGGISPQEVAAHFDGMPERYWESVNESELAWGLQNVHRFLQGNLTSSNGETAVVLSWRSFPYQGYTKVLVCTWDRLGLLSKLAGYISALRLNIVRAEVFTRTDNIVLDVFWLCDGQHHHVADADRLRQLAFLAEGGFSQPPRFISEWACESHNLIPRAGTLPIAIQFNNEDSAENTILTVAAAERLGLLHDMLKVLSDFSLNITEALIDTVDNRADNVFFLTDQNRRKIEDMETLKAVEHALTVAIL
jgi:[protein-PII] uridylyltransferase